MWKRHDKKKKFIESFLRKWLPSTKRAPSDLSTLAK
jgi:hypothetical protein